MAWRRMDRWRTDSCAESLVLRECTKMSTATQTAPSRYIRGGILGRRMRGILGRRMRAQPFVKCKEVQGLSLRAQSCGNAASRLTTDVNVAAEMALRTAFCNVCARAEACGRSRRGGAVHALSATPCNRGKPTFFFLQAQHFGQHRNHKLMRAETCDRAALLFYLEVPRRTSLLAYLTP